MLASVRYFTTWATSLISKLISSVLLCLVSFIAISQEAFTVYVEHLPPNVLVSPDSVTGRSIDIINEISNITGYKFSIRKAPWVRAYHDGINNPNIVFTGLNRIPEREDKFVWVYKLGYEPQYVWALKGNLKKDFRSGHYAFAQSDHKLSQFNAFALKEEFSPNIYTVTTREQAIKMLFARRVDFIVGSERYLKERSKTLSLNFDTLKKIKAIAANNKGLYIALSKSTPPKVAAEISTSMKALRDSGKLKAINNNWLYQNKTQE